MNWPPFWLLAPIWPTTFPTRTVRRLVLEIVRVDQHARLFAEITERAPNGPPRLNALFKLLLVESGTAFQLPWPNVKICPNS